MVLPLIPEEKMKIAVAKTVRDWMQIYIETIARSMESEAMQDQLHGVVFEQFKNETRPRLNRILAEFEAAGLDLHDDIEVQGVEIKNYQMQWFAPKAPWVIFFWPDGRKLKFQGLDAASAVGFFWFWQTHQIPFAPPQGGQRRIIVPGSAEEQAYFRAKTEDLRNG
jgi:hypothetical protein